MAQVPSSAIIPYTSEESALPTLELRPDDLLDTILIAIGDALMALLEEELTVELAAESNIAESATVADQTRPLDVEGRSANAAPTT